MPVVYVHKRLVKAEARLNESANGEENKRLIRQFVNFKTAKGVHDSPAAEVFYAAANNCRAVSGG